MVSEQIPVGKAKNLIGQQFGHLMVLYRVKNFTKDRHPIWHCRCSCGNECDVFSNNLTRGHTTSCGCYKIQRTKENNAKNITGLISGYLVALEPTNIRDGSYIIWKCKCNNCGNICYVRSSHLIAQDVKSCGCIMSYGELQIKDFLNNLNIPFEEQYIFKDLKYKNYLRFDFAIKDKNNNSLLALIEYQGIQHYKETGYGDNQRLITDKIKKDYCKNNKIPLYEIKYDDNIGQALERILKQIYD